MLIRLFMANITLYEGEIVGEFETDEIRCPLENLNLEINPVERPAESGINQLICQKEPENDRPSNLLDRRPLSHHPQSPCSSCLAVVPAFPWPFSFA